MSINELIITKHLSPQNNSDKYQFLVCLIIYFS